VQDDADGDSRIPEDEWRLDQTRKHTFHAPTVLLMAELTEVGVYPRAGGVTRLGGRARCERLWIARGGQGDGNRDQL
jgi:hypothetical protein